MDLRETAFWARGLFPGAVRVAERAARLPGRRRAKSRPGIAVKVAEFSLYDAPADADAPLPVEGDLDPAGARFDVPAGGGGDAGDAAGGAGGAGDAADAAAESPRREIAAFTVNFGRVDLSLRTPAGDDVRVEMFLVAYPDSLDPAAGEIDAADDSGVARIVAGAAALVADDPEAARPTPGSVIPDAVRIGLDSGAPGTAGTSGSADSAARPRGAGFAATGSTTPHLLCVVPYVWPDGVPTITEEPGKISLHEDTAGFPDAATGGSRLTTVTQLVPITDAEYAHADAHGVESLMRALAEADADLRDLRRESVV